MEKNLKVGDLVTWTQGKDSSPGIILDTKPAQEHNGLVGPTSIRSGKTVLTMLPELGNSPEWFHVCELEVYIEKL